MKTILAMILVSLAVQAYPEKINAYPDKPIKIVVGFGVGGSADRMARVVSKYLSAELAQPVKVINKKGAGTLIAANYVLAQPDDGYTIFASTFSPYLLNTILDGNAKYKINDFSFINFQWFDEDLIALNRNSQLKNLPELINAIKTQPKKIKAAVVKGSSGHLMARMLLESFGIPQENLNLVTYNSGAKARAAVAGSVVDFIIISAEGSNSIREYIRPLAIVSHDANKKWQAPAINDVLAPLGVVVPVFPGSVRGFATTARFKQLYPERFIVLTQAIQKTLSNPELLGLLEKINVGAQWLGPQASDSLMRKNLSVFKKYSRLLEWQL